MEWVAAGIAVLAAVAAGWQAWEARRARKDARQASFDAGEHERAALAISEKAAIATERVATAIEAAQPKHRWWVKQRTNVGRSLINGTGDLARNVRVEVLEPVDAFVTVRSALPADVGNGAWVDLRVTKAWGGPSSSHLRVTWNHPLTGGEDFEDVYFAI